MVLVKKIELSVRIYNFTLIAFVLSLHQDSNMTERPSLQKFPSRDDDDEEEEETVGENASGQNSEPSSFQDDCVSAESQHSLSSSSFSSKIYELHKVPGSHPESQPSTPEDSLHTSSMPQEGDQRQWQDDQANQQKQSEQQNAEQNLVHETLQNYHPHGDTFSENQPRISTPVQESPPQHDESHAASTLHHWEDRSVTPPNDSTYLKNTAECTNEGARELEDQSGGKITQKSDWKPRHNDARQPQQSSPNQGAFAQPQVGARYAEGNQTQPPAAGLRDPGLSQLQQFGMSTGLGTSSAVVPLSSRSIEAPQHAQAAQKHTLTSPRTFPLLGQGADSPATSDWRGSRPKTSPKRVDAPSVSRGAKMSQQYQHRQRPNSNRTMEEDLHRGDSDCTHQSEAPYSSEMNRNFGQRHSHDGASASPQHDDEIRQNNQPSNDPFLDGRTTSCLSSRELKHRRSMDLRDLHDQIKFSCGQSMEDLEQDLLEINEWKEFLAKCNPVNNEPRETSIVGLYQWFTNTRSRTIDQMMDGCSGDNCIGRKVITELHQRGLKTANLILYFTQQHRRQDIVNFLLEFHSDCECCANVARQQPHTSLPPP